MSVSNKTNYNKKEKYWKRMKRKNNLSVATRIQYCWPQFSMRYIVQKAYVKIPQDDEKYVFTRPSVFEKSVDKFNCF